MPCPGGDSSMVMVPGASLPKQRSRTTMLRIAGGGASLRVARSYTLRAMPKGPQRDMVPSTVGMFSPVCGVARPGGTWSHMLAHM